MATKTFTQTFSGSSNLSGVVTINYTQNASANTTTISSATLKVKLSSTFPYTWKNDCSYSLNIGGYSTSGTIDIDLRSMSSGSTKTICTLSNKTITHDDDGSKSISVKSSVNMSGTSVGTMSMSKTWDIPSIARINTISTPASGYKLGSIVPITITKANSNFTTTITWACSGKSGTVCTKSSATSIDWQTQESFATNMSTASATCTFTVVAYNGTTKLGTSTKNITLQVSDATVPSFTYTVADSTTAYSTFGGYVQNYSKPIVTYTASGVYGSTIASYKTTLNSNNYTSNPCTTNAITTSGNTTLTMQVTDSRGKSTSRTETLSVLAYTAPVCTYVAKRCTTGGSISSTGENVLITYTNVITALNDNNAKTMQVKYKRVDETAYTTQDVTLDSYTQSSSIQIADISASYAYDFIIVLADSLNTIQYTFTIAKGERPFVINADGSEISTNVNMRIDKALSVGGPITTDSLEILWTGDWDGTDTIEVPGLSKYNLLKVGIGDASSTFDTCILAFNHNNRLRGDGGYSTSTNVHFYTFSANITNDELSNYNSGHLATNKSTNVVTNDSINLKFIYGII